MIRPNRREFLVAASAATAAATVRAADGNERNQVCLFTKPFNSLTFDQLADHIAELGFDGIEAPIRKGGHIEPEQVEQRLPELVEALAKRNLKVTVMTSDVNDPADPLTERVLRTASKLGIKRYRMKYYKYDGDQPVIGQLNDWRGSVRDLAAMNREIGIQAVYQNHAGAKNLGAVIWDLRHVLEGIPVNEIGVAYDIRHATVEGGMSWPITFNMIRPHIDTVYVKDFHWIDEKVKNVPLGTGQVDPKFFDMLRDTNFTGPVSLHEEYLDHRDPKLVPQHLAAIKKDFSVLKKWLQR